MNSARKNWRKTQFIARFGVLLAIEAIFCFTPLGSLPAVGPIVATLAMVPVVITGIYMGTAAGTLLGFFGGLFSFIIWTFTPPNPYMAFLFTPFYSLGGVGGNFLSLVLCFVPRILSGTVAGLVHTALYKSAPGQPLLHSGLACFAGSMTNTLLFLGGAALFFGGQVEALYGQALLVVIGTTTLFSGLPEALIAGVAGFCVGRIRRPVAAKG